MGHTLVNKLDLLQSRIKSSQFVLTLDPQTILPIDLAAPACGKTAATFRTDVTRRPASLPKLTRIGGRIYVTVADLLAHINPNPSSVVPTTVPTPKKKGRPTLVEQAARRAALGAGVTHV